MPSGPAKASPWTSRSTEIFFVLLENLAIDYFMRGVVRGRYGSRARTPPPVRCPRGLGRLGRGRGADPVQLGGTQEDDRVLGDRVPT